MRCTCWDALRSNSTPSLLPDDCGGYVSAHSVGIHVCIVCSCCVASLDGHMWTSHTSQTLKVDEARRKRQRASVVCPLTSPAFRSPAHYAKREREDALRPLNSTRRKRQASRVRAQGLFALTDCPEAIAEKTTDWSPRINHRCVTAVMSPGQNNTCWYVESAAPSN